MTILGNKSIFSAMLQNGPFRVGDEPIFARTFSPQSRTWVKELNRNQLLKTKYRAVRNQILDLLGVTNFDEILALTRGREQREQTRIRAYGLLANMFGIDENIYEITRFLHEYAHTADDVINSLRHKVLAPYSSHIEMTNEIETTLDPVALLLIIFDGRYHPKARFEAKRKLVLMNLAGSIDQREREVNIETKFSNFLDFLNDYVWSPGLKIGDLQISYLYSRHDQEDFSCLDVSVLDEHQARTLTVGPFEKLTLIKRRTFTDKSGAVPIYVAIRKKPAAAKVLKLLRKNEKNPAAAVDDELGLMAVLNSKGDVIRFLRHLTRSAVKANSFMTLEDISDTLTGGTYTSRSTGSSPKTQMMKFFARLGGMRVEFIIHTNASYLNYIYQREVSHDEYEVKRIFDSGVAEFLFPPDIYHLDLDAIRAKRIQWFRKQAEE